jgi:hypothetical protein
VIAFFYTRGFGTALAIAWGSGTVAIVAGLAISFTFDVTTGPVLVVCFGGILLAALAFRGRYGVKVTDRSDRGLIVGMFGEARAPIAAPEGRRTQQLGRAEGR